MYLMLRHIRLRIIKLIRFKYEFFDKRRAKKCTLCTKIQVKALPNGLAFHCAASFGNDSNKIFLHGGMTSDEEFNNHTYEFDIVTQQWNILSMELPCGIGIPFENTQCAIMNEMVIIPTYSITLKRSCTALYDLKKQIWLLTKKDQRQPLVYGRLMIIPNTSRLLYMGGVSYDTMNPDTSIYEFVGIDEGWRQLPIKFPVQLRPKDTFVPFVDNNFC